MKIFQVTLKGYNALTDETDHLIKWIKCPDRSHLDDWLREEGLTEFVQDIDDNPLDEYGFDDGVDVVINYDNPGDDPVEEWSPSYYTNWGDVPEHWQNQVREAQTTHKKRSVAQQRTFFHLEAGKDDRFSLTYGPFEYVKLTYDALYVGRPVPSIPTWAVAYFRDGFWHFNNDVFTRQLLGEGKQNFGGTPGSLDDQYTDVVIFGK